MFNWTKRYFTLNEKGKEKRSLLFCFHFLPGFISDRGLGHWGFVDFLLGVTPPQRVFKLATFFFLIFFSSLYCGMYFSWVIFSPALWCVACNVIPAVLCAYYYFSFAGTSLLIAECNLWNTMVTLLTPLYCMFKSLSSDVGVGSCPDHQLHVASCV